MKENGIIIINNNNNITNDNNYKNLNKYLTSELKKRRKLKKDGTVGSWPFWQENYLRSPKSDGQISGRLDYTHTLCDIITIKSTGLPIFSNDLINRT